MKWLNSYRIRLVLIGFVAAVVLSGGSTKADFTFGEITNLGPPVNSDCQDSGASFPADGLSLFFDSDRPDHQDWDLFMVSRETPDSDWGNPVNLGPNVNKPVGSEWDASISADGLELYFTRGNRVSSNVDRNLYITTRETTDGEWGAAVGLGATVNSSADDGGACISADGLSLYFMSRRSGGQGKKDIWVTTRPTINTDWGVPTNLGPTVNSSSSDFAPTITADGLTLIFSSKRPGMPESWCNLWVTTRRTTSDPWREPFNLGPFINTNDGVDFADISPDGSTLFVSCYKLQRSGAYGVYDIWQAPIIPIVDFNGDGIVDSADMCIMVDNWHTDNTLCDIAPLPFGDGFVDVQDLIILSEHLFEEVNDPTFVAHWALNETEGMFAADSIGDNDAFVVGGTVWQPSSGQVDGALQLNGVDGCAIADFVLNPADGPFSVFAWINGGAPGQVIVSQQATADWLATDTESNLMTELKCTGRSAGPLYSETVITDGQWHCVGLVWNGSHRKLIIDGVTVAEDAQPGLESSQMGLYIGTGKAMEPGTYFSGLIDDVRIYNRVVSQ